MSSFGLQGKLVLVTGAARGVGAATAKKFALNGANVILVDIIEDVLQQTVRKVKQEFPNVTVVGEVCDVSKLEDVENLGERVKRQFPQSIDVLVNNAAIVRIQDYVDITEEDFQKVISTNLFSVHWMIKTFTKEAIEQKRPMAIVNISSITTISGMAMLAHYVTAKSGILGLTKTLAKELGKYNIRVNAIKPGFVDTPMNNHLTAENRADICEKTPLGRIAPPEEIANVIVFYGSDLASFCTGSLVDVNGGMSCISSSLHLIAFTY
ncbi:unnamed protein product [Bursaphelenchus okinawaensis]|uniref:Uncharacterized protein n=1 Tax=Bursaphelenchus okinawaensis TaxID=465554 RepID=A0A811LRC1_9BILA|nr:unnamed protein product [Bursaphelenchus okinawaensis]CAG9126599.1 unnamed protein product [Bursaphelenchus okinawaensis]